MNRYQVNLLHELSPHYTWDDYSTFKTHLQIPYEYLRVCMLNSFKPHAVVKMLPALIDKIHNKMWSLNMNPTFQEKKYMVANIPPQHHKKEMFICDKAADQDNLEYISGNVDWLSKNGKLFYFHGPYADGPMKAAAEILRNACDKNIKCYCENYPAFLDIIKTWDLADENLKRIRTTQILVLWAVGAEWSTQFTTTQLEALLSIREAAGLTTILVSALSPKEYSSRYGTECPGIVVAFKGSKTKETLAMLKKEIESGNR